jgi:hypothetical protein
VNHALATGSTRGDTFAGADQPVVVEFKPERMCHEFQGFRMVKNNHTEI